MRTDKAESLNELAVSYGLILATIWTGGHTQRVLFWITAGWFWIAFIRTARRKETLGLQLPPLRSALAVIGTTLLLAGLMLVAAVTLGTLHGLFGVRAPVAHAALYLVWALVQQLIQQILFFERIEQLTRKGIHASFLTAVMFGLAHLPNPVLTPVTFLGGWALSEVYRRYRSVYPLAFAHGVVGLAIAICVPDHLHHHMRVGLGYLTYVDRK